jgi:GT2 family glycosyltransferase
MNIFVVILNWNGKDYILDCLESVQKLEPVCLSARQGSWRLEIITVDNGSTDGSLELVQSAKCKVQSDRSKFTIIENKENLGITGGNNVGIKYAMENGADYIMLLNSDTIVDKDLVVQLIKVAEADPIIGIIGPKIYFASGHEYKKDYQENEKGKVIWFTGGLIDWNNVLLSHQGVDQVDAGQDDNIRETDFITGCCLLAKRQVIEKIGMLDDKYYLYLEDADFCQRAKLAGYKIIYTPEAKLWHLNAGSSSVGGNLHDYFITRNRLLFGLRYASLRSKAALFRESIRLLLKGRPWQKTAVKDFFLGKLGKGSWVS